MLYIHYFFLGRFKTITKLTTKTISVKLTRLEKNERESLFRKYDGGGNGDGGTGEGGCNGGGGYGGPTNSGKVGLTG